MNRKQRQETHENGVVTAQSMLANAPASGGKRTYLKLPEGVKLFLPEGKKEYRLIFLPWKAGKDNKNAEQGKWVVNRFLAVHSQLGPNDEAHLCPSAAGKPCPICEDFNAIRRTSDWDAIKDLRPKHRELFLVHDLNDDKSDSIMLWDFSVHLFGDGLRTKIARKPKTLSSFADFRKGKVVVIFGETKKIGTGSCVDFTKGIDLEDREDPIPEDLIEAATALCPDEWLIHASYDKLKSLYGSSAGALDDDDDEIEDSEDSDSDDEETESDSEDESEDSEDSDDDEDSEDSDDDEDSDESDDDEDSDESDDETDDESEDEEEKPRKKAPLKKKKARH